MHASLRVPRKTTLTALCAGSVLLLTGCLDVNADLEVGPDATASGTLSLALQKQAASFMGLSDLDAFETALAEGELTDGSEFLNENACSASETDAAFVYSCTFTDTAFTQPGELWSIAKQEDTIVFTLTSTGQDDETADASMDMLGDTSLGSLTVDVTFPGPIISTSGDAVKQTSDTSATISGDLSEDISATVTSEAGRSTNLAAILAIVVFLAILALIVVVVIVMILRRRRPDAIENESAFAAPPANIQQMVAAEAAAEKAALEGNSTGQEAIEQEAIEQGAIEQGAIEQGSAPESADDSVQDAGDEGRKDGSDN